MSVNQKSTTEFVKAYRVVYKQTSFLFPSLGSFISGLIALVLFAISSVGMALMKNSSYGAIDRYLVGVTIIVLVTLAIYRYVFMDLWGLGVLITGFFMFLPAENLVDSMSTLLSFMITIFLLRWISYLVIVKEWRRRK